MYYGSLHLTIYKCCYALIVCLQSELSLHYIVHPLYTFVFRSILAFVMIPMLQRELDEFKDTIWNCHRIRAQKGTLMADGIPNHIFDFPMRYGMEGTDSITSFSNILFKILNSTCDLILSTSCSVDLQCVQV